MSLKRFRSLRTSSTDKHTYPVTVQPIPFLASCNSSSPVSSSSRKTAVIRSPSLRVFAEALTVMGFMSGNLLYPPSKDCVAVFFASHNPFRTRISLFILLRFGVTRARDVSSAVHSPRAWSLFQFLYKTRNLKWAAVARARRLPELRFPCHVVCLSLFC